MTSPIPILNYHSISDRPEPGIAPFTVRPDDFGRHLDLILSHQCTVLTVSGLIDMLDRQVRPAPGTVLITFDDGYEDNLTVAAPLLAARGLPATVFATTGLLPGCPGGTVGGALGPMLPWDSLSDLEAAGIELGAHSHSHSQLDVQSRARARFEIRRSKELVELALGHPVSSFAYPHGYASRWVQQEVRRCGFHSACGVRNAFSHPDDNRWLLARLTVRSTSTCDHIDNLLSGVGAPIASAHELLRTKAWRATRRARGSLQPAPAGIDGMVANNATPT
jgi:peptidoglycan/xylan/chitin deacetylase (PgdA/CDA1 family)